MPKSDGLRIIPLTQGQVAIVDAADYEWLSQWKWSANWSEFTQSFYAIRGELGAGGKLIGIKMHRQILGLAYGDRREGDHRDGNTLDNRRHNLRVATKAQNSRNQKLRKDNRFGLKGVFPHGRKWRASICVNYKKIHLGLFSTIELAHAAYCEAARKYFGEFARTE